ncbi:MAG: SAM-dependent methyltransferase [Saprospiraceae bacterium]|nr:SAM-dependent methyltransferase [Saprospiraceae bacterium]MDC3210367.1 SAM-dependent methyltransferase [Saprospiraceae bacterium]MDG1434368.1 SAM-dependent methyltransferase [Saprospiraceae bacterium]MDG2418950.1 SAM-dependent methyltransferase [Saprospiraceae bacterium]
MNPQTDFIQKISKCVANDTFVRLTLSKNVDRSASLKKVLIKLALIKKELQYSFVYRHETQDITKNFSIKNGEAELEKIIGNEFWVANFFTTKRDFVFEKNKKGKINLREGKPTFPQKPDRQHDKDKTGLIQKATYLQELGILDDKNRVQKGKGDKYKQIKKFVEVIADLLRKNPQILANKLIGMNEQKSLRIVDMGSGKGYLTFALYDYLVNILNLQAKVTGVEIRENLIEICNEIAQNSKFENLHFEQGFIQGYELPKTDILIALHACDTATDEAIAKGIKADAQLIVCAPCCHKQIRKQIKDDSLLEPILNFGILKERQAEIVTDTIRALILESNGYKTKVFEFISMDHTGKNVMIVGQKRREAVDAKIYLDKVEELKKQFGIEFHYLEKLTSNI